MGSCDGFSGETEDSLPIELVTEVCVRLPVKSLVRFRCVCKSWHSLISSPKFVSLHLSRYHHRGDHNSRSFLASDSTPFLAFDNWKGKSWLLTPNDPTYNEMIHQDGGFAFRGNSVNGLLLKATINRTIETQLMLWNPSIRKGHALPSLSVNLRVYYGLGYSHSSNDYKVVVIATNIHIYTLGDPTWRSLDDYVDYVVEGVCSDGVFINGCIYWVSTSDYLVSFDVDGEAFNYILLPLKREHLRRDPVACREMVGVMEVLREGHSFNLWVTRIGELEGSWIILHTIDFDHPLSTLYFNNDQMIFSQNKDKLVFYDFESKETTDLLQTHESCISYLTLYKESLMLL